MNGPALTAVVDTKNGSAHPSANGKSLRKPRKGRPEQSPAFPKPLRSYLRLLLQTIKAARQGDFDARLEVDDSGILGEIGDVLNDILQLNQRLAKELVRVSRVVGREGKMDERASIGHVKGSWTTCVQSVNSLITDLIQPTNEVARVITSVARGDLSKKMTFEIDGRPLKGEFLHIGMTVNGMVDQLNSFAAEVTRVAKEVGTEGKLGGQADIKGASGIWKDLTDNVNVMASNLTKQVRGIIKVVTAVANGDLGQKFVLEAKGEIAALAETINNMTDTLKTFADQVTTVAREVGIEGKLGGQAKVPGVSGTWKDLTDNVNQLAGNLTTQVRAIAEVSTSVAKGDLTRSIMVETQGEVAALKDNINQMISNLKGTTEKNMEQDWLKTNLARFSGMMQGQRNIVAVAQLVMSELTPLVDARYGTFFTLDEENDEPLLKLTASYAYTERKNVSNRYRLREGLVGQCAFEKKKILITQPPMDYIVISSSLGEASPNNILVLPVLFEGKLMAVIELASFKTFSANYLNFLDQLMESIGVVLNVISSTMRTEELLQEVKRSNSELEAQANELEEKAKLLELKNKEVELASSSLQEKAGQLSLISKYKSEFLANMSHELRTPLNSLLILSKVLSENKDRNLTPEQVKFANTVYSAGCDLMTLINDILDLSKVEAGKMSIEATDVKISDLADYMERTFRPVAEHKSLSFRVGWEANVPEFLATDANRVQQVLKNLLSNAFKFTEKGEVVLQISVVDGRRFSFDNLNRYERVIAFSVRDTGIGIPEEKQGLIFEAFQQADGTTSRKYGGTGLGLTISREISRLLGGTIEMQSIPDKGSTFTLYLPEQYAGLYPQGNTSALEKESDVAPLPTDADFRGATILVVDDDKRNLYAISSVLKPHGMEVIQAENGRAAIHVLRENPHVDLVLMDTMMPEMDGFEAARTIRGMTDFKNLPILSLTAKAMQGDREKCLEAGASDYIKKPVDPGRLLAFIHLWLNKDSVKK